MIYNCESYADGDIWVVRGSLHSGLSELAVGAAAECEWLINEPHPQLMYQVEARGQPVPGVDFVTYPRTALEKLDMEATVALLEATGRPPDTLVNPNRYEPGSAGALHNHPEIERPIVAIQGSDHGFFGYVPDGQPESQLIEVNAGDIVVLNNPLRPHYGGNAGEAPRISITAWRPKPWYERRLAPFVLQFADIELSPPIPIAA